MNTTLETRLRLTHIEESLLSSQQLQLGSLFRKTWVLYNHHKYSEKQIYDDLIKQNITSHQVKSITNRVKIEHSKIKALTITQSKNYQAKSLNISKFIENTKKDIIKLEKEILELKTKKIITHDKIKAKYLTIKKLKFTIFQKSKKLNSINKKLKIAQARLEKNTFKLCFGSSELLKQQPKHYSNIYRKIISQKVYDSDSDWKQDWTLSRNNQIYSTGDITKPSHNQEIQYNEETQSLRIRLTDFLAETRMKEYCAENNIDFSVFNTSVKYQSQRMKCRFITIQNVVLNHKNSHVFKIALQNKNPISAKIIQRKTKSGDLAFYLQLSMEEVNNLPVITKKMISPKDQVKSSLTNRKNIMGVDLNAKGLAYTIVKDDGNRLVNKLLNKENNQTYKSAINGFISWDLKSKTTNQREFIISNSISKLIEICELNNTTEIAIENLDFGKITTQMTTGFTHDKKAKVYNEMISSFTQSYFKELLIRKAFRKNIIVKLVNPTFSSIGGYTKYGIVNKTQVDVSASLWLARQGLYGVIYGNEENVVYIKKHEEKVVFPYVFTTKQSKSCIEPKNKWNIISSAIGKDRNSWYKNTMSYLNQLSKANVEQSLTFDPFGEEVPT